MFLNKVHKIIVLGCGGTGSILIPQLCRYLYSLNFIGEIIFVDGDSYSNDNRARQSFLPKFIGTNKAEYQATYVSKMFPEMAPYINFIPEYLTKEKIDSLIIDGTIIINCVDNKAARKYVEDRCLQLSDVAHICCGNEMVHGQVQINYRRNGQQITPTIYNRSPKFNDVNDDRSVMDCQQLAALPGGGQLICANMTAATIALNFVMQILTKDRLMRENMWVPCGIVSFDCRKNAFLREDINEYVDEV